MAQPAPVDGLIRSELFDFEPGDKIVDSGVMEVTGGNFNRNEDFELVQHADGSRVLTSVITGADDIYQVQGFWDFSADGRSRAAGGIGIYDGQPVNVEIIRVDGMATLRVSGAAKALHRAWCNDACLIDMSPSGVAMFMMIRRYDEARGGPQTFQWVGRSLIVDQVLLDGSAELRKLGDFIFEQAERRVPVKHFVFVETLKDESTGKVFQAAFNLYTTSDHRPLAFATRGGTVGERRGYAGITRSIPPVFPAKP
jgi:hypothetical protein